MTSDWAGENGHELMCSNKAYSYYYSYYLILKNML